MGEALSGGLRLSQFSIERILAAFLPDAVQTRFEDLVIPLKVTATDYYNQRLAVFEDGDLVSALAASSAIPAVFRPVRRDGVVYIDGGIFDPVPFACLKGLADIVVAVDVVGAPIETDRSRPNSLDLMFGATQLLMQSIIAGQMERCPPDILVRPAIARFRVLDFMKADQVLKESEGLKDDLKRQIEARPVRRRKQAGLIDRRWGRPSRRSHCTSFRPAIDGVAMPRHPRSCRTSLIHG